MVSCRFRKRRRAIFHLTPDGNRFEIFPGFILIESGNEIFEVDLNFRSRFEIFRIDLRFSESQFPFEIFQTDFRFEIFQTKNRIEIF